MRMDIVSLTRQLVDIESVTGNEGAVGHFLQQELQGLGYDARRMAVEEERANVYATVPQEPNPVVVFSTHMDTVHPFIRRRAACLWQGILRCQRNHCRANCRSRKTEKRSNSRWPTVSRRRRARQPGRKSCQPARARIEVPYQWRAYREP